jgi:hypothetical protein
LIKSFPYPFIVRHERIEVYSEHPEMDYAVLWRYSIRYALAGYIVGKFFKMPLTFAILFPLPLIGKFLYDEYSLMKEKKYQNVFHYKNWLVVKEI